MGNAQMVKHMPSTHSGPAHLFDPDELRSSGLLAEALLASRRLRDLVFANHVDGFGEPAWDTLLLLYAEMAKGRVAVSTGELLAAAAATAPEEIARPYIAWLASHHLVARQDDTVALTPRGQSLMFEYLGRVRDTDYE